MTRIRILDSSSPRLIHGDFAAGPAESSRRRGVTRATPSRSARWPRRLWTNRTHPAQSCDGHVTPFSLAFRKGAAIPIGGHAKPASDAARWTGTRRRPGRGLAVRFLHRRPERRAAPSATARRGRRAAGRRRARSRSPSRTSPTSERREHERRHDEADQADRDAGDRAASPLPADRAGHHEPEQRVAEQVDRRARPRPRPPPAVGSTSVGCAITSSSPTAPTMIPATSTTWRYV